MKCSKERATKAKIVVECLRSNQVANSTLSREGVTNISFHAWSISSSPFSHVSHCAFRRSTEAQAQRT